MKGFDYFDDETDDIIGKNEHYDWNIPDEIPESFLDVLEELKEDPPA